MPAHLLHRLPPTVVHRVVSFMRRSDYASKLAAWWRMIYASGTYTMIVMYDFRFWRAKADWDPTLAPHRRVFYHRWTLWHCKPPLHRFRWRNPRVEPFRTRLRLAAEGQLYIE